MLIESVGSIRPRRIRTRRQHVRQAADTYDIRCMATTGSLCMERMDSASLERGNGALDKSRLIERVSVKCDLHVQLVGDRHATVDRGGSSTPMLVKLQPTGTRVDHFHERRGPAGVALAEQADVHGKGFGCLQHS